MRGGGADRFGEQADREPPATPLLRDVAVHLRATGERPPRLIRPRVEAESVRVVEVTTVESVGYEPAAQRPEAVVRDPEGNEILVCATYNPLCPGGLDALAAALDEGGGGGGGGHCVSDMLNRAHGRTALDPLAVLSPGAWSSPTTPLGTATPLAMAPPRPSDPITTALESALTALTEAAHDGLRRLTIPSSTRVTETWP